MELLDDKMLMNWSMLFVISATLRARISPVQEKEKEKEKREERREKKKNELELEQRNQAHKKIKIK